MNYEQAYKKLIDTFMDNIDDIPIGVAEKVRDVHQTVRITGTAVTEENAPMITKEDFRKMTYADIAELKNSHPTVYQNAMAGNFKENK